MVEHFCSMSNRGMVRCGKRATVHVKLTLRSGAVDFRHYCRHHGHGAYELSGYDLESFGRPGDPVAAACKASAEEVRNG